MGGPPKGNPPNCLYRWTRRVLSSRAILVWSVWVMHPCELGDVTLSAASHFGRMPGQDVSSLHGFFLSSGPLTLGWVRKREGV